MMPPGGAGARADQLETLAAHRSTRARPTPSSAALLDALEPWAAGAGPRLRRRPADPLGAARLREGRARARPTSPPRSRSAKALGQQAWLEARAANDFGRFRDALARHVELRHRYVACFDAAIRAPLRRPARRLRARPDDRRAARRCSPSCATRSSRSSPPPATPRRPRNDGVFPGQFARRGPARRACSTLLDARRLRPRRTGGWTRRCTRSRRSIAPTDVRLTTRYDEHDFAVALYSVPARVRPRALRGAASTRALLPHDARRRRSSLGVHESQSRLWENIVGRSRPFCAWLLPRLRDAPAAPFDGARRRRRSTARSTRSSRR